MVALFLTCIALLVGKTCSNSTRGIEIPEIQPTNACREDQPQLINSSLGYLLSPRIYKDANAFNFTCTWLLQALQDLTIKVIVKNLELDYFRRNQIYFYDGPNETNSPMAHFNGKINFFTSFQTNSSQLYIKYHGEIKYADTSSFELYFEQSAPRVKCSINEIACRNGIKCVAPSSSCNSIDDCGDGTDEQNCYPQLLHFSVPCGTRTFSDSSWNIVGGKASRPGSWPWMVSLRLWQHEPDGHTCGASILNRKWIVSAAHCVRLHPDPANWAVNAGKYQKLVREKTEVLRYVKRFVVHPQYRGSDHLSHNETWYDHKVNDIALAELNAPLPDGRPEIGSVCLPSPNHSLLPGQLGVVLGWGETYHTGNDFVLKEAVVPVITNKQCHKWMPAFNVGDKMFCAGYKHGGQDSCQGDSGGPFLVTESNSTRYVIAGIISTGGDICAAPRQAGVYTQVSDFLKWINNQTGIEI